MLLEVTQLQMVMRTLAQLQVEQVEQVEQAVVLS
jgi:hypothetical protein